MTTTATIPFQLSLSEVSPGNFTASTGSGGGVTITTTGDTSAGTIVVDFTGSGATGQISTTYTNSGTAGSVSMTFANLTITSSTETITLNGTLNMAYSNSGSNATGTLSGSLTMTVNNDTVTVAANNTFDYDGTLDRFVVSGTTTVTHSQLGVWSTSYASVEVDGSSKDITTGTVTLTQSSPASTATYLFTGQSSGTFTISPSGASGSFSF